MLMSAAGALQVSQIVDPLQTARFAMPGSARGVRRHAAVGCAPEAIAQGARRTTWWLSTERRAWWDGCAACRDRRPDEAMAAADPAAGTTPAPIDLEEARARARRCSSTRCAPGTSRCSTTTSRCREHADSVFVFDPVLVTDPGTLVLSMGKERRRGEEEPLGRALAGLRRAGLRPPRGRRPRRGRRHPVAGPRHARRRPRLPHERRRRPSAPRASSAPLGVTVLDYDLPYFTGPEACLHLLSLISPVDVDLAVAYPPLMPTAFWARAAAPRRAPARGAGGGVPAHAGDQRARRRAARVHHARRQSGDAAVCSRWRTARSSTFPGEPLSFKAEGGPTCLTRPVLRDPA